MGPRGLIDAIIDAINIGNSHTKPVPAKVSLQLHAFRDSTNFDGNFNYLSVVGKLNYLGQTTNPDILSVVLQVAKYSSDPRLEHREELSTFSSTSRPFASSRTLSRSSNAIAMPILQAIGTKILQPPILILQSLGVYG